jgi:hypothetical protein
LSCAFAIAAVFVFPIVFVPTALACAVVGGVASLRRRNAGALAASGLGVLIAIGAALKSPAIWLAMGVAFLALHHGAKPSPAASSHEQRTYSAQTPTVDQGQVAVTKALAAARDFNGAAPALTSSLQRYASGWARSVCCRKGDHSRFGVMLSASSPA